MFEESIVTAKARVCNPTVVSRSLMGGAHQLGQVPPGWTSTGKTIRFSNVWQTVRSH